MTFEIPITSRLGRVFLGLLMLGAFSVLAFRAESVFFADRLSSIPLFGTQLAIEAQPNDPQYDYELGNYWIIAAQQPKTALPYLERATQLDPFNGHYWGQLAVAYQQVGDAERAGDALGRGLSADPTTPELLWEAANIYSFLGERENAIDAVHRYVLSTPEQAPIAAQLGWRATRDASMLLNRVLPAGPNSDLSLLTALVRSEDPEASARIEVLDTDPNDLFLHNLVKLAVPEPSRDQQVSRPVVDLAAEKDKARANMLRLIDIKTGHDWTKTEEELSAEHQERLAKAYAERQRAKQQKVTDDEEVFSAASLVWKRLMAESGSFDIRLALPYIQMLIDADLDRESKDAWALLLAREQRLKNWTSGRNLIENASFEYGILNGGFDWQYTVSDAADLGIDHRSGLEGSSSLLIRFKDLPVADVGIVQYIPVKPNTKYEFSGYFRSDSIEAATGPRFQVQDMDSDDPYFESADIRGSPNWTKVAGDFTTASSAHFVAMRIIRNPGTTLIKGQVWVDALSLVEVGNR